MGALPFPAVSSGGLKDMLSSAAGRGGAGAGAVDAAATAWAGIGAVVSTEEGTGLGAGASCGTRIGERTSTTGMAAAAWGAGAAFPGTNTIVLK
ncbi:MAG: hypothetical protein AAB339_04935, partial [Elusimicrobiota bacterium]